MHEFAVRCCCGIPGMLRLIRCAEMVCETCLSGEKVMRCHFGLGARSMLLSELAAQRRRCPIDHSGSVDVSGGQMAIYMLMPAAEAGAHECGDGRGGERDVHAPAPGAACEAGCAPSGLLPAPRCLAVSAPVPTSIRCRMARALRSLTRRAQQRYLASIFVLDRKENCRDGHKAPPPPAAHAACKGGLGVPTAALW